MHIGKSRKHSTGLMYPSYSDNEDGQYILVMTDPIVINQTNFVLSQADYEN